MTNNNLKVLCLSFRTPPQVRPQAILIGNLLEKRYFYRLFKQMEEIVKKHQINLIYSFSNPYASNIVGAKLKEKLGIKFISNFSDPWYDDPYQSFSKSEKKDIARKEKNIIQTSNRIIFNNEIAKKF